MAEVQVRAIVRGVVQGVGYRAWTDREAHALGLKGYVMNLPGGEVEVLLEGEKSLVEKMLRLLRRGPVWAQVQNVEVQRGEASGRYADFACRYY